MTWSSVTAVLLPSGWVNVFVSGGDIEIEEEILVSTPSAKIKLGRGIRFTPEGGVGKIACRESSILAVRTR